MKGLFIRCLLPAALGLATTQVQSHVAQDGHQPWLAWQLQEQDWHRYQELIRGPRGLWSPGLDPITVLGIHAADEQERERLALILARVESHRLETELAFQQTYMKVMEQFRPSFSGKAWPWSRLDQRACRRWAGWVDCLSRQPFRSLPGFPEEDAGLLPAYWFQPVAGLLPGTGRRRAEDCFR